MNCWVSFKTWKSSHPRISGDAANRIALMALPSASDPREMPFDGRLLSPVIKEPEETQNFGGVWHTD